MPAEWIAVIVSAFGFGAGVQLFAWLARRGTP